MATVKSQDGTTIAFDRLGSGPAVILVGGALNQRTDPNNTVLAELLAEDFTVYNFDRRGRGDSADTPPYSVRKEIEDIAALLAEAGGSAGIYGISSGGVLGLRAAQALPDLAKVAMWEPPFIVDDSRAPRPADYVEQLDAMTAAGRRGDAVAYFMTTAAGVPAEFVTGMREQPFWTGFEKLAHTIAYDGRVMNGTMAGTALPEEWTSIATRTLVMDGGETPAFHAGAAALAELLPDAEHRTIPGQSHDVDPKVLAPVLRDFFGG